MQNQKRLYRLRLICLFQLSLLLSCEHYLLRVIRVWDGAKHVLGQAVVNAQRRRSHVHNANQTARMENWTNAVQFCPTPDKCSTILGFWDLKYRADVSDRWSIRAHLSKLF